MSTKNLSQLPQLFRSPFLRKIAIGNYYGELVERLELAGLNDLLTLPLANIFEGVYETLLKNYRSEYIFKNALTQKWFLSRHSTERSYVTDEFRVGDSRVDLAVFSKTSVAFEIKTEFDSPARLPSQSSTYMKVFDLVYVVTTDAMLPKLNGSIPKSIGILLLGKAGGFKTERPSESHALHTDLNLVFDCLRQPERLSIAEKNSNSKIEVPNSQIYVECKRHFRKLLPFDAQSQVVEYIRQRPYPAATISLMEEVPKSLKHVALTLRATIQETKRISTELKMTPRRANSKHTKPNDDIFSISAGEARGVVCA
jgi:hypothetical protein